MRGVKSKSPDPLELISTYFPTRMTSDIQAYVQAERESTEFIVTRTAEDEIKQMELEAKAAGIYNSLSRRDARTVDWAYSKAIRLETERLERMQ